MANLPLFAKGLVVVAIPVAALILILTAVAVFVREKDEAERSVHHTLRVRAAVFNIRSLVADSEASLRGYLLVGDERWLAIYQAARRELPGAVNRLLVLVEDNPSQRQRAAMVQRLMGEKLAGLERLASLRRRGVAALDAELTQSRVVLDRLRAEFAAMEGEEETLLQQRRQNAEHRRSQTAAMLWVGAVFGLGGAVLAMLFLTASMVARVRQLEVAAAALSRGAPVAEGSGASDELGVLERAMYQASLMLQERDRRLAAIRDQQEQVIAERTAELAAANQALREANEQMRVLINAAPLAIWATNLTGKVKFWNVAASELFQWTEDEVLERDLPVIPADQQPEFREWLRRYARGETVRGLERMRQRKDGSLVEVSIWTAPLRNAAGDITGNLGMVVDISARKRLEAQFRQAQKMDALGRLAGGVAHDFNNLLTAISGFASLLLDDLKDEELRSYAEEVRQAAVRAGNLTRQLLAFSRQQTVQLRAIDLNEVVTQSANLLRRVIGEDVRLVTHLKPGLWKIRMDSGQVEQVIVNLAVNARDAMPKGGSLTIETSNVELDVSYTGRILGVPAGSYVLLTVSDTGTGMTPEIRERLFEPFFTTKPAGKGTGLGLSIVYGVVKQSQGEIIVYSEPGQGTTFKIYLPRNEAPSDESPETPQEAISPGSETILVAEDEESVRNLVTTVLRQHGYTVLVADSPAEAEQLSATFDQQIHILLTDLVMPGRSGAELYMLLHDRRPDMKVLYMSGYTENSLVQRALLDDVSLFLQKPFTTATLLGKLREVLSAGGSEGGKEQHQPGRKV